MNTTYFGKTSKNKGKTQNLGTNFRNEAIDPDVYYTKYDENKDLKLKLQKMESEQKKLSVKNKLLENKNKKLNMKLKGSPDYMKEENSKNEYDIDNKTLKIEYENLKNKNKILSNTVNNMQKELQILKSKMPKTSKFKYSNSRLQQRGRYPNMYQLNDYENLIQHLQQSLKAAHEDRRQLIDEITSMKEGGLSNLKIEYSNNIRDKNSKLSEMSLELDKLRKQFDINQKLLLLEKKTVDEYKEKYELERNKNDQLETEIQKMQSSLEKMGEYATMIDNYKKKEKKMEEQIVELCESPFIKQINERDKNFMKLRETQTALSEAQRKLQIENDNMIELKHKYDELTENYNKILEERDKYKEDGMRYKIDKEEREKQGKEFNEVFNKISQFGEVDSNYEKILNLYRGQLGKDGKAENWQDINFLEKMDEFPDKKEELKNEIRRLRIEKGELGKEIEKTKYNLATQQQLIDDMKKMQQFDKKKYNQQIKDLKDKLRRLAELVDRRNIPSDFDLNILYSKETQKPEKEENIIDIKDNKDIINRSVYTDITGFSRDSEDFTEDENCLDLYITYASFDPDGIRNRLGIEIDNLISFISVDFYLHETQTSNLMTGQKPNYNFQLSFKVMVGDNFISYLEDEFIIIELYYLQNNTQKIFANGKIKLSQLIQVEYDQKTRVIHGYVEMFDINDSSIKLCDIKYKMRMRKSILEKLKLIQEKNIFYNESDPVNKANMKIMGELDIKRPFLNMNYDQRNNINNKVYIIRIIIQKGEELRSYGQNPKILPYLYYRFYKHNDHYSNIIPGSEPLFDDIGEYTCVYTSDFHNYLDQNTLDIYVFDGSNPIEVDTDGKEVEMVRNNIENDLIGICKIKLRGLILNDKIEGKFAVLNEAGNTNMGFLIVNIIAEEVVILDDDKKIKNDLDQKVIEGIDPLLVKLALILRDKGYKMNTAFGLFDKDNEDQISLDNFRSIIIFYFKFEQKDADKLIEVVFGKKVYLDKQDFYQIFNNLLSFDDDIEDNKKTRILGEKTEISFKVIDKENQSNNNNIINKNYNTTGALNQIDFNNSNSGIMTNYNNINNINNNNINNNYDETILNSQYTKSGYFNNNLRRKRSRSMDEIMIKVNQYMFKLGKRTSSDLFKIFDQDANLKVGIKELANGFAKMGIKLNAEEVDMIWKSIVGKENKESFGLKEFIEFYEKNKVKK